MWLSEFSVIYVPNEVNMKVGVTQPHQLHTITLLSSMLELLIDFLCLPKHSLSFAMMISRFKAIRMCLFDKLLLVKKIHGTNHKIQL